jgi:D-amino-acid dehydrogenase
MKHAKSHFERETTGGWKSTKMPLRYAERSMWQGPEWHGRRRPRDATIRSLSRVIADWTGGPAEEVPKKLLTHTAPLDDEPWMGCRPCTPDMLPIIGGAPRHDGMRFAFGHAHLGLTLGPVTGPLIAELMTGGETMCDPAPFRVSRFRV